jgi:hypothetical protein
MLIALSKQFVSKRSSKAKRSTITGGAFCFIKESDACPELVEVMTCFACGRPDGA